MKNTFLGKRILALLLATIMMIGALPAASISVFAKTLDDALDIPVILGDVEGAGVEEPEAVAESEPEAPFTVGGAFATDADTLEGAIDSVAYFYEMIGNVALLGAPTITLNTDYVLTDDVVVDSVYPITIKLNGNTLDLGEHNISIKNAEAVEITGEGEVAGSGSIVLDSIDVPFSSSVAVPNLTTTLEGYDVVQNPDGSCTFKETVVATGVAQIGTTNYTTLADAIAAVQNGDTITLLADVTENVTLNEAVGLYYTIDGAGKTMNGTITINPLSDTNNNRRITIQNINFVTEKADVGFITANQTNHYPRLTVKNCTFTGTGNDDTVAIRTKSAYDLIIENCTGTKLHSFLQNNAGVKLTVKNVTVTESKGGLALGTAQNITVRGCDLTTRTYGIRMDAVLDTSVTLNGNVVEAYIPVSVRKATATEYKLSMAGSASSYTATNADGIWMAITSVEYESGVDLNDPSGNVKINWNTDVLDQSGVYGDYEWPIHVVFSDGHTKGFDSLKSAMNYGYSGGTKDEIIVHENITESMDSLEGNIVTDNPNGVTIKNTIVDEWIYCSENFTIGEGVTYDATGYNSGLFMYANNAVINGTVITDCYYQRYANTKLTINEPGSMTVKTETFILRYTDGDAEAGIYIVGDNDDSTIGLNVAVAYFYQGCINAKDADIKFGTYWQTNETDGTGSANLILDNSNMKVTVSDHNMKATGNSTVTLTNGSSLDVARGYEGAVVSIDDTSSMSKNGVSLFAAQIGTTNYATLEEALAAAVDGDTITLLGNIDEDIVIEQVADVKITINGNGKKFTGTITIDGGSAAINSAAITIKNVNFDASNISTDACINLGVSGDTSTRYTNNVTVENCTFTGGGRTKAAIKSYVGGDKNLTVTGCTVDNTMHSLLQATNIAGVVIDGCTVNSKNGINLNSSSNVEIKNSTISVSGYAVRVGVNGGTSGEVILTGNTLKTDNSEGDAVVVLRGTAPTLVDLTMSENVVSGTTHISGTVAETKISADANYWDGNKAPVVSGTEVAVETYYADAELVNLKKTSLSGSGTQADPFLIESKEDLIWFRDTVNTYTSDGSNQFKGKYFKLTADIDLNGINWTPIGTNSKGDHMAFLGHFDGAGHTISNLYINADGGHLGFFARVGSYSEDCTPTITNLKFHNVDVSSNTTNSHGGSYVAGVVANAGGNSVVSNITVTGEVYIVGYGYVGGIVGHGYPDIDNCHVNVDYGWIHCHYWCGGGIIGYAGEGGTPITNSSVSGVEIWSAYGGAGAVAGLLQDGNKLENVSASNVTITSNSDYCMGYIAGNGESSTMTNVTVNNVSATANGNAITSTDAVASINDSVYFNLKSAFEAAQNNDTVVLLKNLTIDSETYTIADGVSITLDMNGKTITVKDNTTKNYEFLYIYGALNVTGNGTIELTATNNREWNAMSAIFHNRGGVLTINNGTFKHLGGTDMAYAVDNSGNWHGDATTNIYGGVLDSTYIAIRNRMEQNSHGASGKATINVYGGKITGVKRAIWGQASSTSLTSPATGAINIMGGEVGLIDTARHAGAESMTTISGGTVNGFKGEVGELIVNGGNLTGDVTILTVDGEVANYAITADGLYASAVAKIGETYYATLKEAVNAIQNVGTIVLIDDVVLEGTLTIPTGKEIVLDLAGKTISQSKQCTTSYSMIENNGALTITGNGKISFKDTSAGDPNFGWGSYTIRNNGTLVVENGTVEHLGEQTFGTHMICAIFQYSGSTTINGGLISTPNYRSARLWKGEMTINGGEFDGQLWVQSVDNSAKLTINGGTFGPNGGDGSSVFVGNVTSAGVHHTVEFAITGGNFTTKIGCNDLDKLTGGLVTGGTFATDVSAYLAEGYVIKANGNGTYGVDKDPTKLYINNIEELKAFRDDVNAGNTYKGITVYLGADIDLGNEEWTPIGNSSNRFLGVFDGQNHTISNLVVNVEGGRDIGFFGFTADGEIRNLTFNNAKVSGRLNIGVVAGTPYTSKFTNIKVTGHVEVNGLAYVGGVGGKNAYANWTDITVNVDNTSYVKAYSIENGNAYRTYVGGVIGFNGEGSHKFTNISSNIKVIGSTCDIGGIFGIAHYGNNFENITFTGSVEAPADAEEVGGIAGVWHNEKGYTVTFTSVTSTGTVTVGDVTTTGSIVGGAYNASNETEANSGSLVIDGKEAWLGIAKIGNTPYATLADAIAAAVDGDTIKLLADIEASTVFMIGKSITINGNGHNVVSTATRVFRVTTSNVEVTLNDVNMVSNAARVGMNDIRGISIDAGLTNVKLTLNNCSVDFTDVNASDWSYAVNISGNGTGHTITVEGGSYEGANVINAHGASNKIVVNNATLTSLYPDHELYYGACIWVLQEQGSSVEATGNTFYGNNTVVFNLGTGTTLVESNNTDNTNRIIAKIGNVFYRSLADAIAAANADDTIVLVADTTLDAVITIDKAITLNLNDKTITGANGAIVFNVKANTTIKNGTILGSKSGTSSGLIDIYANLNMSGVTVETSKILALRFKAGGCTATLDNCNVTGAFKGYGASVWVINSGVYKASSTSISEQLNGTASISGGTFHYIFKEENCAPGYAIVDNGDGTYGVAYGPIGFIDANNNGTLDEGEVVFGSLEAVFNTYKTGDVYIVLSGDAVINSQLDTSANAKYYLNTNVAEGVTVDLKFADDWNYVQKMYIGENVTVKAPYFLVWTDLELHGTLTTEYLYITTGNVLVEEGAVVNANTGEATVQVKNGATLTVNGTVNTAILNVWVGESKLIVDGTNAKVNASWIDIWDGTPSVTVQNGAILDVNSIKASRGGEITVDNATLDANSIELGHNGESAGVLTETGDSTINGTIKMTATGSVLNSDGGDFAPTTDIPHHKVVLENGQYKVVPVIVAQVGTTTYSTIEDAIENWTHNSTLTLLDNVTLSDVITLKSTEHHILNLGTYTMTAAEGKNAIEIIACGNGSAERSAITINADATNPGGINADKKSVIYYDYSKGGITTEDRPIIKINGGVFTGATSSFGTAGIYTKGAASRKCATLNISGGTFNCSINGSGKSKLIISGGLFNYSVGSQGDSTSLRLISGGTFKSFGFMTADSNNTKFWIGTSMGNSNVGVYIDDNGYLVVGGPVNTEPGEIFEASSDNYGGFSSYLQYSSAVTEGLYYTSVEEAFADNNKTTGVVNVYVDELDMTNINYKGTIAIPAGKDLVITYDEGTTPTWTVDGADDAEAIYTETVVDGKVVRTYTSIVPVAKIGGTYYETLQAAFAALEEGDTLTIFAGEHSEGTIKLLATLKNVTIIGEDGAILKDMTIMASDGNSFSYENLTFNNITFENSRISITGWRNGEVSVKNLTVTNCVFQNLNDSTNSAPLHINMDADEAINGFTFTNNVINDITGGSKSGVYAQVTGNVVFSDNVINNVSFRPYVIQVTTDDGIADEFIVTGNTFSGTAAGRAQGLGNNSEGTDTVNLVVSGNIFKDITDSQQICYWNFNAETTTVDLSKNYYDIDILANPSRIYFNGAAQNAKDLIEKGVYPYYADEAMTEEVTAPAIMVTYPVGNPVYPEGKIEYYENMIDAVPYTTNCPRLEGATITLLKDVSGAGMRFMENDMVFDLNGFTYIITAGTGSQGTNTSGFQIRPEVTTDVIFKNGTIKVAEGAPVVWMFNCYATKFVVENVTVDCSNMAYSAYGESCYVAVSREGDAVQFVGNTKIENFDSSVAGHAYSIGGTMTVGENVVLGGSVMLGANASLTGPAGLDVVTADGYKVVYANGTYSTVQTVAKIGEIYYATLAEAIAAAQNGDTITLLTNATLSGTTNINKSITIDGNGHTLTQAEGFVANASNAMLDIMGGATVTFKNLTIDGIKNVAVMRSVSANVVMDNCVIQNCEQTVAQGLLRLACGNATITKSKFLNNKCTMVVSFGFDAANDTDVLTIDGCTFEGNTCGETAVVYFADGDYGKVTNTKFIDNTVTASGNAATLYMGWGDGYEVSGCLFDGNTVTTTHATTKRFASAIFADGCKIENNVFLDNTAVRNGETLDTAVAVAAYYGAASVSGNYWNGGKPAYTVEYTRNEVEMLNYYKNYNAETGALSGEVTMVAKAGKYAYATLEEAFAGAQDGDTVTLLATYYVKETIVVNKNITFNNNNKTVRADAALGQNPIFSVRANLTIVNGKIKGDDYAARQIFVVENGGSLSISDGTYQSSGEVVYVANGSANISGGKFIASTSYTVPKLVNGTNISITGGTYFYSGDPAEYVADGYASSTYQGYTGGYKEYHVGKAIVSTEIDGVTYYDCYLASAIQYRIPEGGSGKVTILESHEVNVNKLYNGSVINAYNKNVVLDLNGKTITFDYSTQTDANATASSTTFTSIYVAKGDFTIVDSGENGKIYNKEHSEGDTTNRRYYRILWAGVDAYVTIEGGNFVNELRDAMFYTTASANSTRTTVIEINGGYFEQVNKQESGAGAVGYVYFNKNNNYTNLQSIVINGGVFKTHPLAGWYGDNTAEASPAPGYVVDQNDDGTYGVVLGEATIGNVAYKTLAEAFAAAVDGDTIVLLADLELNTTVVNTKTVTLDLNGNTIVGTDNATGSFALITNKGTLTIDDSVGGGKITLTSTNDRDWNAYSSVISNTVGGKLVVENGTIEHLGGTDMAYGIDNLTNGKGTYAETIINGGTIKSTYRAIRQFLNGVEAQNILTINGGTIDGANKAIFFHDPSTKANTGTLTVGTGATLKGGVYLFVTEGSTEWPVEVSIAASALAEGCEVTTKNVPEGYVVENNNGIWGVREANYVAQIGEVKFEKVADALAYAQAEGLTNVTITLLGEVTKEQAIALGDYFDLYTQTAFDSVTFTQEDPSKTYYIANIYTGSRTNGGSFVFDGVNIVVIDQYIFEGNVVLKNNSYVGSIAEANCFIYNGTTTVEPGSKLKGVIEDFRGGDLIVDGGRTDGSYNTEADIQDAIMYIRWSGDMLVLKNGAYVKINSSNEVGRLNLAAGTSVELYASKLDVWQYISLAEGSVLYVDVDSLVTTKKITGAGTIVIDATKYTETVTVINADMSEFTGTIRVIGNADYEKTNDGVVVNRNLFDIERLNMRFGSDLSLMFAFKQSNISELGDGFYALVTRTKDGVEQTVRIPVSEWTAATIAGERYYVVEFTGIAGKEMADDIKVVIYDENDNALSNEKISSIRAYAMEILEKTTNDEYKTAIVDMLNYGATAQTHFEYNTTDLANNQLSAEQQALATTEMQECTDQRVRDTNYIAGSNLRFSNKTNLMFGLKKATISLDTYAVFTWTDHKGKTHEVTVEGSSYTDNGSMYVVELDQLVVADARQLVTCTIYDAEGNVVTVVVDSIESNIARRTAKTEALYTAFMKFADSAYEYLH